MTAMDLKPCPFCGTTLRYAAPVIYVHPIGKCILSGRNFGKGTIGQWNKRVDPTASAMREAVIVAVSAIEKNNPEGWASRDRYSDELTVDAGMVADEAGVWVNVNDCYDAIRALPLPDTAPLTVGDHAEALVAAFTGTQINAGIIRTFKNGEFMTALRAMADPFVVVPE